MFKSNAIPEQAEASTLTDRGTYRLEAKDQVAGAPVTAEHGAAEDSGLPGGAHPPVSDCSDSDAPPSKRPRRARRLGVIAVFSLLLPAAFLAVVFWVLGGKPFEAPVWMRERLEQAVSQQLQGVGVEIEEVALVLEEDWDPSIQLLGVQLLPEDGGSPVRLERVHVRLAFAPLLDQELALRDVRVSGVSLTVLRQADGAIQVSIGQAGGMFQFATDLSNIGDQVEGYLEIPLLANLDQFRVEDVTLRFEDLRARRAWTVDGGHITLRREDDLVALSSHLVLLGGRSYASTVEASLTTRFDTRATEFGLNFEDLSSEDISSQLVALSWLEILRAPISGALRTSIDAEGNLGNVNATLQISDGVFQPGGEVRPVPFQEMRSYLTYSPKDGLIRFDELSLDSDLVRVNAHGQAHIGELSQGLPDEYLVQLTLNEFRAYPRNLEDDPIALERSFADFRLRLDPFELDLGQLVVRQNGNQISLDGRLATQGDDWAYALNGHMDAVIADNVMAIWPRSTKQKLRKWIDENIHKVDIQNVNLAVRSEGGAPPDVYADFRFQEAEVRVLKTMPPVQNGTGYGVFQDNQLHIVAESGSVTADEGGALDISGSSMIILNTRLKQSPALVRAKANGNSVAVLSLLDREPLKLFSKANLPVNFAKGHAVLEGNVELVLKDKLPITEVHYDVWGDIFDVTSRHFLPDKEMRGDVQLRAKPERVDVWGDGFLADVPVTGRWHMLGGEEHAGKSWLSGTAELSQEALDTFEVGLPKGTVSQKGTIDYELDIVRGVPPKLRLRSDLSGVRMSSPPLAWAKSSQTKGKLSVDMTLGKAPRIDALSFEAPGLKAEGQISIAENGGLGVAQIDSFAVGQWLSGQGQLVGRGKAPPAVVLTSGRMDMSKMPDTKGSSGGAAAIGPINARLNELVINDAMRLAPMRAEINFNGGLNGLFSGNFNGGPVVSGRLTPHKHGTAMQLSAEQGGKVAASLGVVKAAVGGLMELNMVPRAAKGEYDGVLEMKNIKVQQLPVVAELLNAISVIGLVEQLNGPGILFSDVFARFRLTPERLIVGEGSAVGPSMGLSADGTYGFAQKWFNFQGTVSPIYAVNVVGRPFSKRGEGLIGFNYDMRGPSSQLEISVNPLSVLTPGFFREIFRRPPPDLSN